MREPIGDLKTSVGASLNSASGRALVPLIDLHSIDMRFYPWIPKEAECYHLPFLGEAAETQKDEKVLCSRAAVHRQSQKQSQERILSGCKVLHSCTAVCGPRIKASGLKLRFCTNETQATREKFVKKLQGLGFDISVAEVTAPAPAACRLLKERGLRPHLLVHDDLVPEFAEIDKTNPNCVVVGDAAENFSYANVNEAFRVLIGLEKPVLISLGRGRYYKETDGLKLDVGAYMKALEYACDVEAEVVGKPAKAFFESALAEMGVPPREAIMIGDDIVSDVGGAQQCGMRAVQVRTGKYRYTFSSENSGM
uniref:Phospholysine phosphohistidine inorganic pyrophosphate phosphatase n=1 Tax=Cairina moschata TaxID=8855 RepID=A0A8C3C8M5_CAIMO